MTALVAADYLCPPITLHTGAPLEFNLTLDDPHHLETQEMPLTFEERSGDLLDFPGSNQAENLDHNSELYFGCLLLALLDTVCRMDSSTDIYVLVRAWI